MRAIPRAALGAAGALGGAAALESGVAAAGPARASTKIRLFAQVCWQGGVNYAGTVQELTEAFINKHWTSRHPGVEVTTIAGPASNGNAWSGGQTTAAVFAGAGPDIITGCCSDLASYQAIGLFLPLTPLMRRDNISPSIYAPAELQFVMAPDGTIYGLPDYNSIYINLVDFGMLDDLGLRYPEPDWTYEHATDLWRRIAGTRRGKKVYGASFDVLTLGLDWLVHAWGGATMDASHTKSRITEPASLAGLEWAAPLFAHGICQESFYPSLPDAVAFSQVGSWDIQWSAMSLTGLKWDFFPMPSFPIGRTASGGADNYGINAFTKNPVDLVWDLMKFICVGKPWQRFFNARLAFATPNQNDPELWDDWMRVVRAEAPPLRDKHLEYFYQALPGSWGGFYFRYEPNQALTITNKYLTAIFAGQMSPMAGAEQIEREVDALEALGPRLDASSAQERARYRRYAAEAAAAAHPVQYPKPPTFGAGSEARLAPGLARQVRPGSWLVRGAGAGVNSAGDNCTFVAGTFTESSGTLVCRLTSINTVKSTKIADGAKVGLMVRADLGSLAASAGLEVAMGRGVHFHSRAADAANFYDQKPGGAGATPGLISADAILAPDSRPAVNYLLKGLWLRLDLKVDTWTAYVSFDGRTWMPAGQPVRLDFVGAWAGLFVTSHAAGQFIEAQFDHLSGFAPNTTVQIGTP